VIKKETKLNTTIQEIKYNYTSKTQDLRGKTLTECQGNVYGARDWNLYSINNGSPYNSLGIHQFYMGLFS